MKLSEVISNGYDFVDCHKCKHYSSNATENECKAFGDYCYPEYKVKDCECFEESPIYIGDLKGE